MNSHRFRYLLGLLVGVALLFGVTKFINLANTLEKFNEYPWPRLSIVLVLSLGYYLLKALRWHYFLVVIGVSLSPVRSMLVYIAGQWFAFTPAGEFVRAYLLTHYGVGFSRGSAAVAVQVVFDFLSLAVLGSIVVFRFQAMAALVLPFTAALIVGVLAFAYVPTMWRRGASSADGFHIPLLGARWQAFFQYSRELLAWKSLLVGLILGLLSVLVGAAVLFEVSNGYLIPVDFPQSAYIYSLSQLAGGLSILPHGLGAVEGSSVALFYYAGVDTDDAASAIVLFRLVTVGWGLILGGVSLLLLRIPLGSPPPAPHH